MPTRPGLKIGRILGIPIYLHASWVIIFFLITFSLAMQFTQEHPRWSATQHWTVGIVTSLLFFASVLFHELAHSVMAQYYKIQVVSITLFIFGGVARIGREPSKAIQEFNIAVRSEEHTSELQSLRHLVCRLLLEKKKKRNITMIYILL